MKKTCLSLFVLAVGAFAQPIGVGIKGGLPFTDLFDANQTTADTETKRYIVGPMIDLRLPAGLGIEFNALYTKANFSNVFSAAGSVTTAVFDTDSWEFPLLLKYRFGSANAVAASVRPYVEAGASFRRLSDVRNIGEFITGNQRGELDRSNTGFVVGGGVEIRALFLRVAPEVRFTRWGTDHFTEGLSEIWKTNRNQAQFLVGLYF